MDSKAQQDRQCAAVLLRSKMIVATCLYRLTGLDPNRLRSIMDSRAWASEEEIVALTRELDKLREIAQNALAALRAAHGDAGEEETARAFFGHPAVRNPGMFSHDEKAWKRVNAWLKDREDYEAIRQQLPAAIPIFLDETGQ